MTRAATQGPLAVTLTVSRAEDLLAQLYPNGQLGGVTVEGPAPGPLGAPVVLTVAVQGGGARHFTVRTRLGWVRRRAARGLPEGYGLDFVSEDVAARDRLLAHARGHTPDDLHRAQERLGVGLKVSLRHAGRTRRELLADLSAGGAFIQTAQPLAGGSKVEVGFRPPGALRRLELAAQVVWRRSGGEVPGMGLRFLFKDEGQAAKVLALVGKLAARRRPPA